MTLSSPAPAGGRVRQVVIPVDGGELTYEVDGASVVGPESVMLDHDDDLTKGNDLEESGYGIFPFIDAPDFELLVEGLTGIIAEAVGRHTDADGFELVRYHEVVTDDDVHGRVISDLFRAGIPVTDLPIPIEVIERRASAICGVDVTTHCPGLDAQVVFVRVVRPGSRGDHNPPHRDVWLDHLRHAVNGYVPLAGSTARSSLGLVPGSHRWPESDIERTDRGARLGGITYEVPAVVGATRPLELVRPDPAFGDILLFSPYLVHGGGINFESDITRVSLELRFWRAS